MDKAKAKVDELLHKTGKHDTTVHETVAPAVTHEQVQPTRHEQVQTAIDKEIHQDHYHTSVQPVVDKQILPEQHHHQTAAVEERTFEHGSPKDDRSRASLEAGQFRDERVVQPTTHTTAAQPTVAGEHIHHHVYETIQPVVQRETIQPEVVHTTKPIHEVHHQEAVHHATTALPSVSKEELERKGGTLAGRGERYDHFAGEPKYAGLEGTGTYSGTTGTTGTTVPPTGTTATSGTTGATRTTDTTTTQSKPSLMDKLNPKVDATGDGNPGFMK